MTEQAKEPRVAASDIQTRDPLVVSVSEAAIALGVSDDLVYRLVATGQLPCVRLGRRRLIPTAALTSLVESAFR
jgi:excisionase family DNA binding protein